MKRRFVLEDFRSSDPWVFIVSLSLTRAGPPPDLFRRNDAGCGERGTKSCWCITDILCIHICIMVNIYIYILTCDIFWHIIGNRHEQRGGVSGTILTLRACCQMLPVAVYLLGFRTRITPHRQSFCNVLPDKGLTWRRGINETKRVLRCCMVLQ